MIVPGLVFSTNLVHQCEATSRLGLGSWGGPAHHLTGALLINYCNVVTMVSLVLLSDLSFLSYASHHVYHAMDCLSTSMAFSNRDVCNVLMLEKLLHNYH